jgi:chaperonin cofactor prefoldin
MLVNLSQLEPDTITYKNVGKAFVLAPKSEIISSYEASYAAGLATMKKKKSDKEVVDKSVESCLGELREHLQANPSLAHAVMQQQGA